MKEEITAAFSAVVGLIGRLVGPRRGDGACRGVTNTQQQSGVGSMQNWAGRDAYQVVCRQGPGQAPETLCCGCPHHRPAQTAWDCARELRSTVAPAPGAACRSRCPSCGQPGPCRTSGAGGRTVSSGLSAQWPVQVGGRGQSGPPGRPQRQWDGERNIRRRMTDRRPAGGRAGGDAQSKSGRGQAMSRQDRHQWDPAVAGATARGATCPQCDRANGTASDGAKQTDDLSEEGLGKEMSCAPQEFRCNKCGGIRRSAAGRYAPRAMPRR